VPDWEFERDSAAGLCSRGPKEGKVFHLTITQEEAIQIEVMIMDGDEQAALIFIKEKILPKIKEQQQSRLRSHLDGGKGSAL
jgi:hypothetical protein